MKGNRSLKAQVEWEWSGITPQLLRADPPKYRQLDAV